MAWPAAPPGEPLAGSCSKDRRAGEVGGLMVVAGLLFLLCLDLCPSFPYGPHLPSPTPLLPSGLGSRLLPPG